MRCRDELCPFWAKELEKLEKEVKDGGTKDGKAKIGIQRR